MSMLEKRKEPSHPKVHPDPRVTSASEEYDPKCPEAFHVIVEQDGKRKLVHRGDGIQCPPNVEKVHVLFADEVEYRIWWVELETTLEPDQGETGEQTTKIQRLRSEGDSAWNEPWAVEVALEERPGNWLCPIELRYEGIAMYAPVGHAIEHGIENAERGLLKRVR